MNQLALILTLFVFGVTPIQQPKAADEGLYDPVPPEGSAFVRFVSDYEIPGSKPVIVNDKTYDYLDYKEASSYFVFPEGEIKAKVGDASESFPVEAGDFYTVILADNGTLNIKDDPQNQNQAKAQILLYNLSGQDNLSLKTADGAIEVIPAVGHGEVADKQINPVRVSLAVYNGDQKVKDLGSLSLERSQSYSAILTTADDVNWVKATTNTTR